MVTVTDEVPSSATASLNVYATFPFQADWDFDSAVNAEMEISKAEDNAETTRILSDLFASWQVVFKVRSHADYRTALRFYAKHRLANKWFYLEDYGLEELQLGRFDSELRRQPNSPDSKSYSFAFYTNRWVIPTEDELGDLPVYGEPLFG